MSALTQENCWVQVRSGSRAIAAVPGRNGMLSFKDLVSSRNFFALPSRDKAVVIRQVNGRWQHMKKMKVARQQEALKEARLAETLHLQGEEACDQIQKEE